jgi:hypothetical protein
LYLKRGQQSEVSADKSGSSGIETVSPVIAVTDRKLVRDVHAPRNVIVGGAIFAYPKKEKDERMGVCGRPYRSMGMVHKKRDCRCLYRSFAVRSSSSSFSASSVGSYQSMISANRSPEGRPAR